MMLAAAESRLYFLLRDSRCLRCQLQASRGPLISLRYASNKSAAAPSTEQPSPPSKNSSSSQPEIVAPLLLDRPLGLSYPPFPGQNTGIDQRTLQQRRDDFVDREKHIARRNELKKEFVKPYFREWTNLKYNEGKTFKSNPRLFKRDLALFFPNLYGITLASQNKPKDTTTVTRGKITVVSLFSGLWAEQQVATFTDAKQNPGLFEALATDKMSIAQRVSINVEESALKAWLVKMFMWRMRQQLPVEQHDRYFLVQKGMTSAIKEAIGMLNSKVGYVYLLDDAGHIRWAGSGSAEPEEKESLNAGLLKLIRERSNPTSNTKEKTSGKPKPRVIPHKRVAPNS